MDNNTAAAAQGRSSPYHQQGEHGLPHVEAVPPVVVGDPAVALAQGVHEPHQRLWTHAHQRGSKDLPSPPTALVPCLLHQEVGTSHWWIMLCEPFATAKHYGNGRYEIRWIEVTPFISTNWVSSVIPKLCPRLLLAGEKLTWILQGRKTKGDFKSVAFKLIRITQRDC